MVFEARRRKRNVSLYHALQQIKKSDVGAVVCLKSFFFSVGMMVGNIVKIRCKSAMLHCSTLPNKTDLFASKLT